MGQEIVIPTSKQSWSWEDFLEHCQRKNLSMEMRMIDGNLAFPDEKPEPDWREVRIATANGMITLRRELGAIRFVIWGNASPELMEDHRQIAEACREVSSER
jgi:hypothetical protein